MKQSVTNFIRTTDPTIPTFPTYEEALFTVLLLVLGLLPYYNVKFDTLPSPYPTQSFLKMKFKEMKGDSVQD